MQELLKTSADNPKIYGVVISVQVKILIIGTTVYVSDSFMTNIY